MVTEDSSSDRFYFYAVLATVVATLLAVCTVANFATAWPQRDSFIFFDWIARWRSGSLSLLDFISARNNEHLVGFHYFVSLCLLIVGGHSAKVLMLGSAVLLIASLILLAVLVARDRVAVDLPAAAALVCFVPLLNPVQASYFLWEFQLWWYIVLAAALFNVWLIERWDDRAAPAVVVVCLLASGSGTQGAFLWLTAAGHYVLLNVGEGFHPGRTTTRRSIIAVGCVMAFSAVAAAILLGHNSGGEEGGRSLSEFVSYFPQLIGGGFGIRNATNALLFGAMSLISWAAAVFACISLKRHRSVSFRAGLLLSVFGLLCTLAFAFGRQKHGIDWALWTFHHAPPLLPFFAGLGLLSVGLLGPQGEADRVLRRVAGGCALVVALVPSAAAIPDGVDRAEELLRVASAAHVVTCRNNEYPRYIQLRLNGLEGHGGLYDRVRSIAVEGCLRPVHMASADQLLVPPRLFQQLASQSPETRAAVDALWWVYAAHLDLQRAFPPQAPGTPERLLNFGFFNAKRGTDYAREQLLPHASTFLKIGLVE